jgi:hypothetical protein
MENLRSAALDGKIRTPSLFAARGRPYSRRLCITGQDLGTINASDSQFIPGRNLKFSDKLRYFSIQPGPQSRRLISIMQSVLSLNKSLHGGAARFIRHIGFSYEEHDSRSVVHGFRKRNHILN